MVKARIPHYFLVSYIFSESDTHLTVVEAGDSFETGVGPYQQPQAAARVRSDTERRSAVQHLGFIGKLQAIR